jgi:hypothetical protein
MPARMASSTTESNMFLLGLTIGLGLGAIAGVMLMALVNISRGEPKGY